MNRVSVGDLLEVLSALEAIENRKLNRSRAFLHLVRTGRATANELADVMGYGNSRGYTRHLERLVKEEWAKKQDWGLYAPSMKALKLIGSLPISVTEDLPTEPYLVGKIVIVGSSEVREALRKAGIFERSLVSGSYLDTIGFDVFTGLIQEENHFVRLQFWHCSPDPQFAHLRPHYYKNADCVIVATEDVPPLTTGAILGELHNWIRQQKRPVPVVITSLVPKFRELQDFLETEAFKALGAVPAADLGDATRQAASVIIRKSREPDRVLSTFSDILFRMITLLSFHNNDELTTVTLSEALNLTIPLAESILASLQEKGLVLYNARAGVFELTPEGKHLSETLASITSG
ncbi:MAG: hypothetical protein ACE5I5_02915 [Candidatus Heimdallarchaeota archaeon]